MNRFKMYYLNNFRRYLYEKRFTTGIWNDIKRHWKRMTKRINLFLAHIMWRFLVSHSETVDDQIVFHTFQDKYTCNPKYLCDELLKRNKGYRIIWPVSKKTGDLSQFPEGIELVKLRSYEYYVALARSKFWIENAHNFTWEGFPMRDDQILINLWHGSMGLKRIDPDSDSNENRRNAGKLSGQCTSLCISNSDFENMVFRTSYWPYNPIAMCGHARNDIFFRDEKELSALREKVCEQFGISPEKKILIYAPTFRDDPNEVECFDIDYALLRQALEERFGGEWVILTRFHMHTQKMLKKYFAQVGRPEYEYVISADSYTDMQELIAVCDAGITDYSSWVCDYVLSGKPAFLFVTDIDSYVTERGFYYPLEKTPFPICTDNAALYRNITGFDAEKYACEVKEYLSFLGCCEDGHACERIAQIIDQYIEDAEDLRQTQGYKPKIVKIRREKR